MRHFFGFENFGPIIFLGRLKICPNEHLYLKFYRVPPPPWDRHFNLRRAVINMCLVELKSATETKQEILLSEDLRSIRLSFMIKEAYRRSHELSSCQVVKLSRSQVVVVVEIGKTCFLKALRKWKKCK